MSKKETTFVELQCADAPPEVIHLNIGMKGELHTYHLAAKRQKRGRPVKKSPRV